MEQELQHLNANLTRLLGLLGQIAELLTDLRTIAADTAGFTISEIPGPEE